MPTVLRVKGFKVAIYVETGGRHHRPHCHLYWGGSKEAQIALDTPRTRLSGSQPPQQAWEILEEHWEVLLDAWNDLNR